MPRDEYDEFDALEDVEEKDIDDEELDEEDLAVEDPEDWDDEDVDEDVKDLFNEAQKLDYGHRDMVDKMRQHTANRPELFGGDVDANLNYADVGEEAIGGENPTPDQDNVDEIGEGVGLTYEDDEPLNTDQVLQERDENPWELNPASSPNVTPQQRQVPERELEPVTATPGGSRPKSKTRQAEKDAQAGRGTAKGRSAAGTRSRGGGKRRETTRGSRTSTPTRGRGTGRRAERRRKSSRTGSGRAAAKRK